MNCSTLGLPVHHQLPEFAGVQPRWIQGIRSGDGVGILGKTYLTTDIERVEMDSVVGNIGGEKEAE